MRMNFFDFKYRFLVTFLLYGTNIIFFLIYITFTFSVFLSNRNILILCLWKKLKWQQSSRTHCLPNEWSSKTETGRTKGCKHRKLDTRRNKEKRGHTYTHKNTRTPLLKVVPLVNLGRHLFLESWGEHSIPRHFYNLKITDDFALRIIAIIPIHISI